MRDRRFIAAHRGGPLDITRHRLLAAWAAECAQHVLHYFTACSSDDRPRRAIETARAWARGEATVGDAQKASVAAHAAARDVKRDVQGDQKNNSATAAARAAGHAVATAHMADHCLGPVWYAMKAVEAAGESADLERAWQIAQVPDDVRELVLSAIDQRLTTRRG